MRLVDGRNVRLRFVVLIVFTTIAVTLDLALSRISDSGPSTGESFVLFAAIPGSIVRSLFYGVHGAPPGALNDWVLATGSSLVWTPILIGLGVGLYSILGILERARHGAA